MTDTDDRRSAMIEKVKALWAQADHPNTGEAEARTFRLKATDLMARYQIDEMMLDASGNVSDDIMVIMIRLDYRPARLLVPDQRMELMHAIAYNLDCRGIIHRRDDTADEETGKPVKGGIFYQAFGYRHDIDTTRMLYSSLVVDLLEALLTEDQKGKNYRENFAHGYANTIHDRMAEMHRRMDQMLDSESDSKALAIRSKHDKVQDFLNSMYPPETLGAHRSKRLEFDGAGRNRGAARAQQADLGATERVGGNGGNAGQLGTAKKELGR